MKKSMLLLVLAVVAFTGRNAAAWPRGVEDVHPRWRQENVAQALSVLSTAGPILASFAIFAYSPDNQDAGSYPGWQLAFAGLVFGPSVGYIYAGEGDLAAKGLLIRVGITALTIALFNEESSRDEWINFSPLWLLLGGVALAGHAAYDISRLDHIGRSCEPGIAVGSWRASPYLALSNGEAGVRFTTKF